jgi:hypothetical protein
VRRLSIFNVVKEILMSKQLVLKSLAVAVGLFLVSGLANAAFIKGMTKDQATAEIKAQLKDGKSLADISATAKDAGVTAADLTTALIQAGQNPSVVAKAVAAANPAEASAITKAAVAAAPTQAASIQKAVLSVPGVNPSDVLIATASDRPQQSRQEQRQEQRQEHQRQEQHQPSGGGAERPKNTASPS